MDLAVLVAQVAAVAVGDGVAVAGVADVDGGVELAAHGDLGLYQLRAQALYRPLAFLQGGDDHLFHFFFADLAGGRQFVLGVEHGFAGAASRGQQGQGDQGSA